MTKEIIYNMYYIQNISLKKIAKEFHISDKTLVIFMKDNNIPIKERNNEELSEDIKLIIINLYKNGNNPRQISEKVNISQSKIKSFLLSNGIWESKTKITKEEAIDLYLEKKMTIREIAKLKDCSIKKAHNAVKHLEKRGKYYKFSKKELEMLYLKYQLSVTEIANLKHTSRYFVNKALIEFGFKN